MFAGVLGAILLFIFAFVATCICIKRSRETRLENAKAYLETVKKQSHDDDPEDEEVLTKGSSKKVMLNGAVVTDPTLLNTDPNAFIQGGGEDSEEEEVSSAEARDQVPGEMTSNEQAIEILI